MLLAPVLMVHWLVMALGVAAINLALQSVTDIVQPWYDLLASGMPWPLPTTEFNGQTITVVPMVGASGLLLGFFGLSGVSGVCRKLDKRMGNQVSRQVRDVQTRQAKTKAAAKAQQTKDALSRRMVLVLVQFPFGEHADALAQLSASTGVTPAHHTASHGLFTFQQPEPALHFATKGFTRLVALASQHQSGGYEQPKPVQLVLHAQTGDAGLQAGVTRCQWLLRYCQASHVVFSQQLFEVMVAQNIAQNFPHSSMGVYTFPNEGAQDIYQLDIKHADQQVYF